MYVTICMECALQNHTIYQIYIGLKSATGIENWISYCILHDCISTDANLQLQNCIVEPSCFHSAWQGLHYCIVLLQCFVIKIHLLQYPKMQLPLLHLHGCIWPCSTCIIAFALDASAWLHLTLLHLYFCNIPYSISSVLSFLSLWICFVSSASTFLHFPLLHLQCCNYFCCICPCYICSVVFALVTSA
jgi:hypothetical protein